MYSGTYSLLLYCISYTEVSLFNCYYSVLLDSFNVFLTFELRLVWFVLVLRNVNLGVLMVVVRLILVEVPLPFFWFSLPPNLTGIANVRCLITQMI